MDMGKVDGKVSVETKPTRLGKDASEEEILASLPVQARVRPARWVFAFVFIAGCVGFFFWMIFLPPRDAAPTFWVLRFWAFIALPLSIALLPWAFMGLFFPRHLTFDEERIWTRDWSVDWADVRRVRGAQSGAEHEVQLGLWVEKAQWEEGGLRKLNRWDSGLPFRSGGLTRSEPVMRTQAALAPSALVLIDVFEELVRRARRSRPHLSSAQRAERARQRWGSDDVEA